MQILLVEDDAAQAEAVAATVTAAGHDVSRVDSGEKAVVFLEKNFVDLVILDWRLPGMSGLDVLGWIRHRLGAQPGVLFLTSKMLEIDIVQALEGGADEYIVKPFRQSELVARINALRRRLSSESQSGNVLRLGRYLLDTHNRYFSLDGHPVTLTDKEFDMAVVLFKHPGRIISRDLLARLAWGREHDGYDVGHGERAAEFLKDQREALAPLADDEFVLLYQAIRDHEAGETRGDVTVLTCWDADRLDLGRVGMRPQPARLCTAFARRPETIAWAYRRSQAARQ